MEKKSKNRSPLTTRVVNHSLLPQDQQKSWILTDELDALKVYFTLLEWIRGWGSKEGIDFGGIRSLKCVSGYPLVEVCVSAHGVSEKKFLISRASLYVLALFSPPHGWVVFQDSELKITFSEKPMLLDRRPCYTTTPWDALRGMDSPNMKVVCEASEIFFVHICEASRLSVVQLTIGKTLIPISVDVSSHDDDDELRQQKVGSENAYDVLNLLAPIKVELNTSVSCHNTTQYCIKRFKQLCRTWYEYDISRHKLFELDTQIADLCGVTTVRTLKSLLCLLANTNLRKILMEWQKRAKEDRFPPNFTKRDFEKMCSRIHDIEANRETGVSSSSKGHFQSPQKDKDVGGTEKRKRKKEHGQ